MKTEIILQILTILTVIIVGIVIIIKNKRSATRQMMMSLVNTIFEDIYNSEIGNLVYQMPQKRKKETGVGFRFTIIKTNLFDTKTPYCHLYHFKNGYTIKVESLDYQGYLKGYSIEVSLIRNNRLFYSKLGSFQQ